MGSASLQHRLIGLMKTRETLTGILQRLISDCLFRDFLKYGMQILRKVRRILYFVFCMWYFVRYRRHGDRLQPCAKVTLNAVEEVH